MKAIPFLTFFESNLFGLMNPYSGIVKAEIKFKSGFPQQSKPKVYNENEILIRTENRIVKFKIRMV